MFTELSYGLLAFLNNLQKWQEHFDIDMKMKVIAKKIIIRYKEYC